MKTAKLGFIMRRMAELGVAQAKCSTTVELATACGAGMKDVLLAYPVVGANAARVRELAGENAGVRISGAGGESGAGGGVERKPAWDRSST